MVNLFSVFDPSSKFLNMNWISLIFPFIFLFVFWLIPHPTMMIIISMIKSLKMELKMIFSKSSFNAISLMLTLITLIILMNSLGLVPFVFTPTSHIMVTLSLALPIWLSTMIMNWIHQTKTSLAHLVPLGTPSALMSMMVLIESISLVIRPVTLSIRLTANMIAGHLLITLISLQNNFIISIPFFFGHLILNTLELAVASIQAYVFMILCSLYISEVK